ncbi:MAG: ATP-binding protein [Acidimicrobiia bacterium]|nr:ATP-binding protein [Acidimicrobiia bacterium]
MIAVALLAFAVGTALALCVAVAGWRRGAVRLPPHRSSTAHLQALYPFVAEGGLGASGVYVGREVLGANFCFDPWDLYRRGVLTNPNVVVAGQVGRGKSALVKTYLRRQQVFGRRAAVMDPKGEYGDLAAALGVEPIRLEPGGGTFLNPLDPGPGAGDLSPEEVRRRQSALLGSVAAASLGRDLRPAERAGVDVALASLAGGTGEVTLPAVVDALLEPAAAAADRLRTTPDELARSGRDVALELRRLCEGDLRGMFDGPTSVNVDWDGPAVILDLAPLFHSDALGLLMTCAAAWLQAAVARPGAGKRIIVVDEAWAILSRVGIARWLQASFKLSRAYGLCNVAVIHRLSDLSAAGAEGSEAARLAQGLLADAETRVVYAQPPGELERATELLGLTRTEAELLPRLGRGVALWKVGQRSFVVEHQVGAGEAALVNTDARMA